MMVARRLYHGAGLQQPGALRRFAAVSLLLLGAGCATVGPTYREPELPVPAAWQGAGDSDGVTSAQLAGDLSLWWQRLGDATLSDLVEQALRGSADLRAARAKLREARARRALAGAEFFPTVTASGAASASRKDGGAASGGGTTTELYSAGFDASWEPDLFGGVRRGAEAAQADLEASEASLHDTQVSLTAEVALNYVEARAFQARLAIARNSLASQSETLQLTAWRAQAGLVSVLDVEQARANRDQTRAQIPVLETGLAEAEHRLAVLLGLAPEALREKLARSAPIPAVPDRVAVGIPADTLRRRPDVRAAERKLAAETARIGQATAARYPSFTLSGSIGLEALALGASGGAAVVRSLAAGVAGVLFDGGRLRRQVEIQTAVQEQALAGYEAAVLAALEDVENALASLTDSRDRQAALRDAAQAALNAALLARQRYAGGLTDFQTVLDSERTVLSVEDGLVAAEADGTTALIRLYKALGGGWSPDASGTAQNYNGGRS